MIVIFLIIGTWINVYRIFKSKDVYTEYTKRNPLLLVDF